MDERSSYRQILKATTVFGGTQVFSVLISFIKSKVIALLLGPAGMGMLSLFQNPSNLISLITGLGLNTSGIRDVAAAGEDETEVARTVGAVRTWLRLTGVLGMVVMFLLAPWLSEWSFGNRDHTNGYRLLSVAVLIMALGYENEVIIKGRRRLKKIAKALLLGSFFGLLVSIPLYYFWGEEGIVPSIIATAALTYLFNWMYAHGEGIKKSDLRFKAHIKRGHAMVKVGILLVLTYVIQFGVIYGITAYLRYADSLAMAGLFTAGMTVTNMSVNMIYQAIAGDFYPRLSAIKDNGEANEVINQQSIIATLMSTPIIIGMMVFLPYLIPLLLSHEFVSAQNFIMWLLLASATRPISTSLYYKFLADGKTGSIVWFSVWNNGLLAALYVGGFYLYGLDGMGIGNCIMWVIYLVIIVLTAKRMFGYHISGALWRCTLESIVTCSAAMAAIMLQPNVLGFCCGITLLLAEGYSSVRQLQKHTGFLSRFKHKKQ